MLCPECKSSRLEPLCITEKGEQWICQDCQFTAYHPISTQIANSAPKNEEKMRDVCFGCQKEESCLSRIGSVDRNCFVPGKINPATVTEEPIDCPECGEEAFEIFQKYAFDSKWKCKKCGCSRIYVTQPKKGENKKHAEKFKAMGKAKEKSTTEGEIIYSRSEESMVNGKKPFWLEKLEKRIKWGDEKYGPYVSFAEGMDYIRREYLELETEIHKKNGRQDPWNIEEEALDLMAVSLKMVVFARKMRKISE